MREGKNMGLMTSLKKPTPERYPTPGENTKCSACSAGTCLPPHG
jgi:hypothetical protein